MIDATSDTGRIGCRASVSVTGIINNQQIITSSAVNLVSATPSRDGVIAAAATDSLIETSGKTDRVVTRARGELIKAFDILNHIAIGVSVGLPAIIND